MLVLSRKPGQKILLGDDITITISKVHGDQVSIGIEAPSDVLIRREELVSQWDDSPIEARKFFFKHV